MRVLHVIDPRSPDDGSCTLRLLADVMLRMQGTHHALVVGGRNEVELAVRCGVDVAGSICPPQALPWSGARALRAAARHLRSGQGSHDLVHAWGVRCGALVTTALPGAPVVVTVHAAPEHNWQSWHWLRKLKQRSVMVLAASTATRRQLRSRGFATERVALLPSGVDAQAIVNDRPAMRALLAERAEFDIDDRTLLVGLLGEPADRANVAAAATIAARVALSGRAIKLIVHPHARHRHAAEMMMSHLQFDDVIAVDDLVAQPWTTLTALDAALFVTPAANGLGTSALPLLWALASGTPVVAEESESLRDVLEDGSGCMVVKRGDVNAAAKCLARLYDDPQRRNQLAEQGRAMAAEMFDIDAYVVRLQHSYDLLLANSGIHAATDAMLLSEFSGEAAIA